MIPPMLEKVGLSGRGESLLKNFSKGMQQRLGIAQSLIADPDALIFDELSSGLDPIGRHALREVLVDLKSKGRTILFSSHELTEVESLCDRVLIIHQGRIVTSAAVGELIKPLNQFEITIGHTDDGASLPESLQHIQTQTTNNTTQLIINDIDEYTRVLDHLKNNGIEIIHTHSRTRSLEDYFIELVNGCTDNDEARVQ